MAQHRAKCIRPVCTCEGVPLRDGLAHHRPGTAGCIHHPMAGLHRAERHGASFTELIEIERRIRAELPGDDCPF